MQQSVHQVRAAMASTAELLLFGNDLEHLNAVAEAAFDEIARVEQLLSRFDATSELSRINREAAHGGCLVDFELLQILSECRTWWQRTDGAFDITVGSRDESGRPLDQNAITLDVEHRRIAFQSDGVLLDLGGYGKGYALDCAARLIRSHGVTSGLLHLGTSSVLAIGSPPEAASWRIGLIDPTRSVFLVDAAVSTSATRSNESHANAPSDLIDPRSGQPLSIFSACTITAPTASMAEAISTAFVVLGPDRSNQFLKEWNETSLNAIWFSGE